VAPGARFWNEASDVPGRMDDRFASEKVLPESSGTRAIVSNPNIATRPDGAETRGE
jgi:hypothetical protein